MLTWIICSTFVTTLSANVIDVWYGLNQNFGNLGNAQKWVNILGNVSDSQNLTSLEFSLNGGGYQSLTIGPGTGSATDRRTYEAGDFIIEIDKDVLLNGVNSVTIRATNNLAQITTETVTLNYTAGTIWPESPSIDWSIVTNLQDVSQIVDGKWAADPNGIRTTQVGYDRLVAIGDMTWDDYEILTSFTVHSSNDSIIGQLPSVHPAIGIIMRWQGHTNSPVTCSQPHCGWLPETGTIWFEWDAGGGIAVSSVTYSGLDPLQFHTKYHVRFRVEDLPNNDPEYRTKIWLDGQPEPVNWQVTGIVPSTNTTGSLLLVAHQVDMTFGDVTITSLADDVPPVISNVQTSTTDVSATVQWDTNESANSQVAYGLTNGYELGTISAPDFVMSHSLQIPGLSPNTLYHYQITSTDPDTNSTSTTDATFTTQPPDVTPPIISNLQASPGTTTTTITWTTDEPATTELKYGLCVDYGLGTYSDPNLVTNHKVTLSGLNVNTLHHFLASSRDFNGNKANSQDTTFATLTALYLENFNAYSPGDDPLNWQDTTVSYGLGINDANFKIFQDLGDTVFGTDLTLANIHSHYSTAESPTWTNYEFSGRIKFTNPWGSIGVTFFSDYPNSMNYYRLYRNNFTNYHITTRGTSLTGGTNDSGVDAQENLWYRYRIQVEDTGTQTNIRGRVWQEGTSEPETWPIDCYDDSVTRLTSGTIGLYSLSNASKYWDDLEVRSLNASNLAPPLLVQTSFESNQGFTGYSPGADPNLITNVTDNDGINYTSNDGARIWNNASVPPDGTQALVLGWLDPNDSIEITIPGTTHGVSTVQFDYASLSSQTNSILSVSYDENLGAGWVESWNEPVVGADPNWMVKPWKTITAPIFMLGDVDILIKNTGTQGVVIDNLIINDNRCVNYLPQFTQNPLAKPAAIETNLYLESIANDAMDPNSTDTLTFTKLSGDPWLSIDPNGVLSGTPLDSNVGENAFTVQVQDQQGGSNNATLLIEVLDLHRGEKGMLDFSSFASNWLLSSCGYCGGSDLNNDDNVDIIDLVIFTNLWLESPN